MKIIQLTLVLIFMVSCTTSSTSYKMSPAQKPDGSVSYTYSKIKRMRKMKRNKAIKEIRKKCAPKSFRIIKEEASKVKGLPKKRRMTLYFVCD